MLNASAPDAGPTMSADRTAPADFRPTALRANLALRAQLLRRMRQFFDGRGFLEVETPLLSADTVVDRHLDPLPVTLFDDPREPAVGRTLWLQTSPEYGMKRLLAAGAAAAMYQVARVFRGGERGAWHNPEFTMVEWYRVGDGMQEGMQLLSELAEHVLGWEAAERISYRQAFLTWTGVDPLSAPISQLAQTARQRGIAAPAGWGDDRDAWLDLLLTECVQPHLGQARPAILYDYPASQAALARVRDETPPVAERFELFARGIELANGYHELTDAHVLRERNAAANRQRLADGKYLLPEDSRLLAAMDCGLPPCTGVALGFDRLVMLAAEASEISQVIPFPIERA